MVESLATSLGIPFVRRPIDRTELLIADELALCGTLHEITLIKSIESFQLSEKSLVLGTLQARLLDAVRGIQPHPSVETTQLLSVRSTIQ
jgi:branched-chain amino acid aminotransferase